MRIWLVRAYEPFPTIDGTGRYLRYGMLAKALTEQGHEVFWWASNFDHVRKRSRQANAPVTIEMWPGFSVRLLPAVEYHKNISLDRVRHNRSVAAAFKQEVSGAFERPDLILACIPTLELTEQAVAYGVSQGIPVVVDVEDEWPDLYLHAFPAWLRQLGRLALAAEFRRAKYVLQSASAIFACSQTYLQWALNYAGRERGENDAVFVLGYVRPGLDGDIDPDTWRANLNHNWGVRQNSFVATFLGQFGASYDLETVIEAARRLSLENSNHIHFVLAGNGDKNTKLRELAQGLPNVSFTGWLDQAAMVALLRSSSVGLAAYTDAALQSLPYKPFEYMAAGLPIVSSLKGELANLLEGEAIGLQYEAGNATSLAARLRELAQQPDLREKMGQRALELFEQRFSTEVIYPAFVAQLLKIARDSQ